MTWWMWILLWFVLAAGGLAFLVWQGYRLFRKGMGLLEELADTGERLGEIGEQVDRLGEPEQPRQPAIFADPVQLRADRMLKKRARARRRARSS